MHRIDDKHVCLHTQVQYISAPNNFTFLRTMSAFSITVGWYNRFDGFQHVAKMTVHTDFKWEPFLLFQMDHAMSISQCYDPN